MNLKETIRFYRKQKKMTQEELASALGISTPAVNKWESGITSPDISLLAPLARLLDISLDTLLSFEKELSNTEIEKLAKEADMRLKTQTFAEAWTWILQKIHVYPNCESLIWQMAVLVENAQSIHPEIGSAEVKNQIHQWLEKLLQSQDDTIRFHAASSLFHQFLNQEKYAEAEGILQYFSTQNPVRKQNQALLYEKTGRTNDALRSYEELIFQEVHILTQALSSLNLIAIKQNDLKRSKHLTEILRQTAKLFEMGTYHELSCQLDLALAEHDQSRAQALMDGLIDQISTIFGFTASSLYQHMTFKEADPDFLHHIKQQLLDSYKQEFDSSENS